MAKITIELETEDARAVAAAISLSATILQEPDVMITLAIVNPRVAEIVRCLMTYVCGKNKRSDVGISEILNMDVKLHQLKALAASIIKQTDPDYSDLADKAIASQLNAMKPFHRG